MVLPRWPSFFFLVIILARLSMMASLSLSPHQSIAHRIDAQMGLLHEYYYIHENVILSIAK